MIRQFYRSTPCVVLVFLTTIVLGFVALSKYGNKGFALLSLPSSPWTWTGTGAGSSSFSVAAFGQNHSSPANPNTDLYPSFKNEKMQRAVAKLEKALKEETILRRGKDKDVILEKIEAGLARARALIMEATLNQSRWSLEDDDYVPHGDIYRNAHVFHKSYVEMEKRLKIYIYEEGEPPLFHNGPSKDIYSIEGLFLNFIGSSKTHPFRTHDPNQAHLYFLPFSVVMILHHLFDPITRDKAVLQRVIGDYVRVVSDKYPYWNRSLGADHFVLSCHDWGPRATWYVPQLYFTSIRALCNANISEFFNPRKDVSIPEINLKTGDIAGLTDDDSPSNRTILAFFAGQQHGRIRPLLFRHWKEKDDDIRVYEQLPDGISYREMMKSSKFCICPSGHEVASPRIAEAIYARCVPVLISQQYVLPFSDVLDWEKFSIRVAVDEIPKLKEILMGVGDERYGELQARVKQVQRHFVVNDPPRRFDVFHMIIHSIWLRRLNLRVHG